MNNILQLRPKGFITAEDVDTWTRPEESMWNKFQPSKQF